MCSVYVSMRIPTDREVEYFIKKWKEKRRIQTYRPDWTIGSYNGCCVGRFGATLCNLPCIECKRKLEWRNVFYELHDENEERAHILLTMEKWKKKK